MPGAHGGRADPLQPPYVLRPNIADLEAKTLSVGNRRAGEDVIFRSCLSVGHALLLSHDIPAKFTRFWESSRRAAWVSDGLTLRRGRSNVVRMDEPRPQQGDRFIRGQPS